MSKKKQVPQQAIVLKGLRGREGLTQEELANKIKVSTSTVSRMETGQKEISSKDAKKLASALNTKSTMFKK